MYTYKHAYFSGLIFTVCQPSTKIEPLEDFPLYNKCKLWLQLLQCYPSCEMEHMYTHVFQLKHMLLNIDNLDVHGKEVLLQLTSNGMVAACGRHSYEACSMTGFHTVGGALGSPPPPPNNH